MPEKPRTGKYCPRCHAMTHQKQTVCGQCGHQFRTGLAPETQSLAPDPLHRTRQFVLPPRMPSVPSRTARAHPYSRRLLFAARAVLLLTMGFGTVFFWHARTNSRDASPIGVWETTLTSKTSGNAHLEFALAENGTGRFSWTEPAQTGQMPLVWHQSAEGLVTLSFAKSPTADPVSQTLTAIFSSHPWRLSSSPHRLTLGTLIFTEKS